MWRAISADSVFGRSRVAIGLGCLLLVIYSLPGQASAQSARSELHRVRQQIQQELRSRPEVMQARQAWTDAVQQYNALRKAVVAQLNRDAEYLRIRAEMWKLEDELTALAHQYRYGIPPADRVFALATAILELQKQLSAIEDAVISQHHELLAAREAYEAARARLAQVNRDLRERLRNDPRFQGALSQLRGMGSQGNRAGGGRTGSANSP